MQSKAVKGALSAFLSVATVLLLSAPASALAASNPLPESNRDIVLSPQERALVLKGKVVLRDVPNPGRKGRTYEAVGILQGSLDEAVAVLTDYGRYPDYMPGVAALRICEANGPVSVVEVKLHLPLGVKKQYRLKYSWTRGDSGFELIWEKVPWPELKPSQTVADTSGFWFVRKFEEGGLLAVYQSYTDPGRVPLGLTKVAQGIARSKIPDVVVKLRERILEVNRRGKK